MRDAVYEVRSLDTENPAHLRVTVLNCIDDVLKRRTVISESEILFHYRSSAVNFEVLLPFTSAQFTKFFGFTC